LRPAPKWRTGRNLFARLTQQIQPVPETSMSVKQVICCDQCSKDISAGDGRQWHICMNSQVTAIKPGSAPRVDAGERIDTKHFCDERCLSSWAITAAKAKDERQAAYQADLDARAAAAAARSSQGDRAAAEH
jgi:hypothetical protein